MADSCGSRCTTGWGGSSRTARRSTPSTGRCCGRCRRRGRSALADLAVGVVVFGSALDAHCGGGADLRVFADMDGGGLRRGVEVCHDLVRGMRASPRPLLAGVRGTAVGGGVEVVLHCAVRFAASTARLGQPEIGVGCIPPGRRDPGAGAFAGSAAGAAVALRRRPAECRGGARDRPGRGRGGARAAPGGGAGLCRGAGREAGGGVGGDPALHHRGGRPTRRRRPGHRAGGGGTVGVSARPGDFACIGPGPAGTATGRLALRGTTAHCKRKRRSRPEKWTPECARRRSVQDMVSEGRLGTCARLDVP
jgi:Enoyl-CoA hydratase/isomerase